MQALMNVLAASLIVTSVSVALPSDIGNAVRTGVIVTTLPAMVVIAFTE